MAELLTDPGHIRQDLQYIATAIRHDWDIPEQLLSTLPKIAGALAIKGKPKEQVQAMRVLLAMKEQNERRDTTPGQTTVNVGVKIDNRTDDEPLSAIQFAERYRQVRISRQDGR